jgi:hypothetical protein
VHTASLASKLLEIHAGQQQEIGLLSPNLTPKLEQLSVGREAPKEENLTSSLQEVHLTN